MNVADFTDYCLEAFRRTYGEGWEVSADLSLKWTGLDREVAVFLDTVFLQCDSAPELMDGAVERFVASFESVFRKNGQLSAVDLRQIVPVIKHRSYLKELNAILEAVKEGSETNIRPVSTPLNSELIVLYAQDEDARINYLTTPDLKRVPLGTRDLKELAIENFSRLYPEFQCYSSHGTHSLELDGNYESTLILCPGVWQFLRNQGIDGKLVIAIPARNAFLASGKENYSGMKFLRERAREIYEEEPYAISSVVFEVDEASGWISVVMDD